MGSALIVCMPSSRSSASLTRIFFTTVLLLTAVYANAESGFYLLTQPGLPTAVERAAESILMVTIPSGPKVTIDLMAHPTVDDAVKSMKQAWVPEPVENLLRKRIVQRCFDQKAKTCDVFKSFETGTMFFVKDLAHPVSAFHVFQNNLNGNQNLTIDLILQKPNGEVVFGSNESEIATVSFADKFAVASKTQVSQVYDFIELKLSKPLTDNSVHTLDVSETELAIGESVFQVGYPGQTYDRLKVLGQPDSDGIHEYVTLGSRITLVDYLIRTGKDPKDVAPNILDFLDHSLIATTADAFFGMSGCPMLSSEGKVTGLLLGVFPTDSRATPDPRTIGMSQGLLMHYLSPTERIEGI